jgi:PHD/YefM family antitoxin component YafN of YafNO toxin-antitoxin module
MKTIEITTASKSLAEYTSDLENDFVLLTSNNKPVAAIVSLRNIDPESLALSTNQEFLAIIEQARRECAEGKKSSLGSIKEHFGL